MNRPTMEEMEICKGCGRKVFEVGKSWNNGLCDECNEKRSIAGRSQYTIDTLAKVDDGLKKLSAHFEKLRELVEELKSLYKK